MSDGRCPERTGRCSAAVLTTGCRLNQAESDALAAGLEERGVAVVTDPSGADTCYVNTCTVTTAADRSSLNCLRRVLRLRPKPRVVVMGCLAEAEPTRLGRLQGVDEVWDNGRKQAEAADRCPRPRRSRPVLKVQDGCAAGCAYCRASRLRGRPRSVPPARVRQHCEELADAGYGEVVLTGLNLGCYEGGLASLLTSVLDVSARLRVRLASLDPAALDEKLPAVLADPRICPHFHLSLQSGDDELLRRMGRRYTAAGFAELAGRLRAVRPEACIGADIIVGFPGEDEVSFRRTRGVLDALPVDYLHVFSYSPRPGTPAFCLADTVASVEKRARVRELRSFSDRRRAEFGRRHIGSVREAVVESNRTALTDNYIRLAMPAAMAAPGALVGMLIERSGGRYVGRPTTPVTA